MFRKATKAVIELGWTPASIYALNRTMERLGLGTRVYYYYLLAQPVPESTILPPGLGRTITVREILEGDPALARMPVPDRVLHRRFAQPSVCLGAFKESELVAYLWLCFGAYDEDEVRCKFVPQPKGRAVWDFDVYVFPRHRIGLGFACLWDEANARLRAKGVATSFSRVSAFNPISRRSHQRMHARIVGTAIYLVAKPMQLMLSNRRPFVHLSLREATQPTIDLQDR